MAIKKPIEKVFCIFHRSENCNCIKPVTDAKTLNYRIKCEERRLTLMKFWEDFKIHFNETERDCAGCDEPIKAGFVCRKNEEVHIHSLDCWKKLENKNKEKLNG